MGDDPPHVPFEGTVRRSHSMEPGSVVLVLERYVGDIDTGDFVTVTLGETSTRVQVATMAWGSSFGYESPPLTLVVTGLDGSVSYVGAQLRGEPARDTDPD
jgi:hypothetical protein